MGIVGHGLDKDTKGYFHTPNWINTAYEDLVDPNSQKTLQLGQISGKTKIRHIPNTVTNPYQILLSADENLDNTSQLIDRINEIYEELGATKTVLDALSDASGNILLGYCTQHFQLPTWNNSTFKHGTLEFKNLPSQAKEFFLLETRNTTTTTRSPGVLINDDTTNETAYPIAKPKDVINSPTRYIRFYDFSEQLCSWMIVCGALIEHNSINGFTVQTTNSNIDLSKSNENYFVGTIPIKMIERAKLTTKDSAKSLLIMPQEQPLDKISHSIHRFDANEVQIPIFALKSVSQSHKEFGMTTVKGITDLNFSLNNFSFDIDEALPLQKTVAWSSFRTEARAADNSKVVLLYLCFKPIYGTIRTEYETVNFSKL